MPQRAVIYARYSSENQRLASIDDQVELCRRYASRMGWEVTEIYSDAATSGASAFRPGLTRLQTDARARQFDVVLCEALDRLGRNLADVARLFETLTFLGIQVHATNIGQLTAMHVGIMGTMAQLALSDLRDKTRRGLLGRVRAGRIPGGLAFGYEVVPPAPGTMEAGERRIRPEQAQVVARIFRDFAGGKSPRRIAQELNAAGVPGPDGRPWIDTTIRGQPERGTGILNNAIYVGRLEWNRCSYVKDPGTGRRVARPNPREQWEIVAVPELRIIEDALWDAARRRQAAMSFEVGRDGAGVALNRAHRRQFLFSGLLTCGGCGGGYTIVAKDRYGCAAHRQKGTCDNSRTIARARIESRVLAGLRERMLTPDLVGEFIAAFAEESSRRHNEAGATRARLDRELAEVERKLGKMMDVIESGGWSPTMRGRLDELEARKARLVEDIPQAGAPDPAVLLHPNAAQLYREQVAKLETALTDGDIRVEASEILRALIERITLTPDASAMDGLRVELCGDLAEILSFAASDAREFPARVNASGTKGGDGRVLGMLSVVAGTGFEPVTFRL